MNVQSPLELLAAFLTCVGLGIAGTLIAQKWAASVREHANGKKA